MKILGIETSCDETAASVVENGRRLLSNIVQSQIDIHAVYGGVVPEVAARSHLEVILPVIQEALDEARCTWDDIDAIAVTYAPGLIGSLLIGSLAARTLALLKSKPLYAVHHVEGHVYANFLLDKPPSLPLLALIVSGGHSQLVLFHDHGNYELLGQTQDDAVGEAFDKVAKILGLPYPGGPSIAKAAELGDSTAYTFPKAKFTCPPGCTHTPLFTPALGGNRRGSAQKSLPLAKILGANNGISPRVQDKATVSNGVRRTERYGERVAELLTQSCAEERCHAYDFSFSGLKTAVLRRVQVECGVDHTFPSHQLAERLDESTCNNIAASFQRVAVETLVDKTIKAYHAYSPASVVIAGGVAANQELRRQLSERLPIAINYAPMNLCTDNAAMIASLGYYMAEKLPPTDPRTLEVIPSLSMTKTAWAEIIP